MVAIGNAQLSTSKIFIEGGWDKGVVTHVIGKRGMVFITEVVGGIGVGGGGGVWRESGGVIFILVIRGLDVMRN